MILDDVIKGKTDRLTGLREIYDYSGLPRPALAKEAKVDYHTIQYSVTEASGGRIVAEKAHIRRIGKACGISEDK